MLYVIVFCDNAGDGNDGQSACPRC